MKLLSVIVSLAIGFAGAFAVIKLSETAETDWFGVPKLMVAVVLFVVFFVTAITFMRCLCNARSQKRHERESRIDISDN